MGNSEYQHGFWKMFNGISKYWCDNCKEWILAADIGSPTHSHWFNKDKGFICNLEELRLKKEFAEQELRESSKNLNPLANPITAKPIEVNEILKERNKTYSSFINNAGISQALKAVIQYSSNWRNGRLASDQREALELIALKIGRILTGDPDCIDNWDDIAGYAILVSKRLKGELL
jgi:hypothetical protein